MIKEPDELSSFPEIREIESKEKEPTERIYSLNQKNELINKFIEEKDLPSEIVNLKKDPFWKKFEINWIEKENGEVKIFALNYSIDQVINPDDLLPLDISISFFEKEPGGEVVFLEPIHPSEETRYVKGRRKWQTVKFSSFEELKSLCLDKCEEFLKEKLNKFKKLRENLLDKDNK